MNFHNPDIVAGGKVVLLTGPFGDPERVIALDRPMSVAEVIDRHALAFRLPTIAVLNGEPVLRGDWPARCVGNSDRLAFIAVPGGGGDGSGKQIAGLVASIALSIAAPWAGAALFGAGTLGASLFSAAVLVGGSMLLNALFPPPATSDDAAGSVFAVAAAANEARPLGIIPALYGRMRYAPPFASRPYAEYQGNDQYLYQLFAASVGKVGVSRIDIGDTEAWNAVDGYSDSFSDIEFEIVQPGQSITLFPANVVTSGEVAGQPVPDPADVLGPFVVNAAGTTVDRIAVDFAFPGGLWSAGNGRSIDSNSAKLRAQYRPIDNAGAPTGGWTDVFAETITQKTRTPQRMTRSVSVAPGRYEVKFFAEEAFDPNDGDSVNAAVWAALRGYLTGFVTPPDCTLIAMKARANEQLSQASASQIRVTATRHLSGYADDAWSDPVETRSIAWAAADILRGEGHGLGLDDAVFDADALAALDATWAGRGDTFNYLFDRSWTARDALAAVLRAGRTQFVRMGGQIGFNRLEPKAVRRAVFSLRNVVRGSFSHRIVLFDEENPDSVTAAYLDETVWAEREVEASLASIGDAAPQRIEYVGITDHDQAWREAVTDAAINAYQREFVSFTAEWEGKLLVRGEPVLVMHPFIEGVQQAAANAVAGGVISLDRDVETPDGDLYMILRGKDGREWGPCLVDEVDGRDWSLDAIDRAAVEADMGTLASILPDDTSERMHVLVCTGETRPFNGLVVSAVPSGGKVDITVVNDAPEVYAADETETLPSPWATPTLPAAIPSRPLIVGLVASLRVGTSGLELDAMWQPAAGATGGYLAQVSYDNGGTWTPVYADVANRLSVAVLPQALRLRVAAIGELQGPWATRSFADVEVPEVPEVDVPPITPSMLGAELAAERGLLVTEGPGSIAAIVTEFLDRIDELAGAVVTNNAVTETSRRVMSARLGRATAAIFEERLVRASEDGALAMQITQLGAEFENSIATGLLKFEAEAGEDEGSVDIIAKGRVEVDGVLSQAAWIIHVSVVEGIPEAYMAIYGGLKIIDTVSGIITEVFKVEDGKTKFREMESIATVEGVPVIDIDGVDGTFSINWSAS